MIFVITGTEAFPLNRLVEKLDELKKDKIVKDDVFIQLGSCTYCPSYCEWKQWLPFDEMCEKIKSSDLVIAHAGAGTTLLSLEIGKPTIIIPRRKKFGEHVDDHQMEFAEIIKDLDLALIAYDVNELPQLIEQAGKRKSETHGDSEQKKKLLSALDYWFDNDTK